MLAAVRSIVLYNEWLAVEIHLAHLMETREHGQLPQEEGFIPTEQLKHSTCNVPPIASRY